MSALGGKVVYKAGSHRVMGLLAMSRALGDHFLRPYVIAEPEVRTPGVTACAAPACMRFPLFPPLAVSPRLLSPGELKS